MSPCCRCPPTRVRCIPPPPSSQALLLAPPDPPGPNQGGTPCLESHLISRACPPPHPSIHARVCPYQPLRRIGPRPFLFPKLHRQQVCVPGRLFSWPVSLIPGACCICCCSSYRLTSRTTPPQCYGLPPVGCTPCAAAYYLPVRRQPSKLLGLGLLSGPPDHVLLYCMSTAIPHRQALLRQRRLDSPATTRPVTLRVRVCAL